MHENFKQNFIHSQTHHGKKFDLLQLSDSFLTSRDSHHPKRHICWLNKYEKKMFSNYELCRIN